MKHTTMGNINLIGTDDFIIAIPTFDALDLLANSDKFNSWLKNNPTKQIVIVDVVQMFMAKRISDASELQAVKNFWQTLLIGLCFKGLNMACLSKRQWMIQILSFRRKLGGFRLSVIRNS